MNKKDILAYIKNYKNNFYKFANPTPPTPPAQGQAPIGTVGNTPAYKVNNVIVDANGNQIMVGGSAAIEADVTESGDAKKGAGSGVFGGPGTPGNPQVKDMQVKIQDLARTVTTYKQEKIFEKNQKGQEVVKIDPKTKKPVYKEDPKKQFNDFLIEQYTATLPFNVQGEEWTTNLGATQAQDKQATELTELSKVIDGLNRIGASSKEFQADGRWDFRTQNAIKNVYALAYCLVKVIEDFGVKFGYNNVFSRKELEQFKQAGGGIINIDTYEISKIHKKRLIAAATALIPLISRLKEQYKYYVGSITQSPVFQPYLNEQFSLMTLEPGGDDPGEVPDDLEAQDRIIQADQPSNLYLLDLKMPNNKNVMVNVPYFPISYLKNVDNFKKLAKALGYDETSYNDYRILSRLLVNVLDYINSNVKAAEAKVQPSPAQPSPPQPSPAQVK